MYKNKVKNLLYGGSNFFKAEKKCEQIEKRGYNNTINVRDNTNRITTTMIVVFFYAHT